MQGLWLLLLDELAGLILACELSARIGLGGMLQSYRA